MDNKTAGALLGAALVAASVTVELGHNRMERHRIIPRSDWREIVAAQGVIFDDGVGERPYWLESACYSFTPREIDALEAAAIELQRICLQAAQHVIDGDLFSRLGIDKRVAEVIRRTWSDEPPAIYGRFDLAYDGNGPPKLLEYNADTPTALLEASVVQWHWLQDSFPRADQWNSIHELLVAKWSELRGYLKGPILHVAHLGPDAWEDAITATYVRDTAIEAGINTSDILINDIGWDDHSRVFVGMRDEPITSVFKLYPWEWMVLEEFGQYALDTPDRTQWIEPIWKMLWSNKAILPILWEMFPGHANLLPAYCDGPGNLASFASKPILGREGLNVIVVKDGDILCETPGEYDDQPRIYQELASIPCLDGNYPVAGVWMVGGVPAGMGIRESRMIITDNRSSFVPHFFEA